MNKFSDYLQKPLLFSTIVLTGGLFPNVLLAASPRDFAELIYFTVELLIRPLIFLVGSLAFLVFFWGIVVYISKAGDENEKERGRNLMLYGVIALFVMVSVWGLIGILKNTFFENAPTPIPIEDDIGTGGGGIGGGGGGIGTGGGGIGGGGGGGGGGSAGGIYDNNGCHCVDPLGIGIPCPLGNRLFGLPLPPGIEKKCPGDPGYISP